MSFLCLVMLTLLNLKTFSDLRNSWYIFNANEKPYYGRLNFTHCALSFGMMIMMSGITKVFNKSAKRNFHQRESHDDDKIATIYYDILEQPRRRGNTPRVGTS